MKKAESELMDDTTRERIDSAIATARRMLIDERKWTVDHPDLQTDTFMYDLRAKTRDVLIEDELIRRRKRALQMAEEGRIRQEEEARDNQRKRKKEEEKLWETTRDERIGDWRKFTGQVKAPDRDTPQAPSESKKKLKKMKPKLLG